MLNATSKMGEEIDSLADAVNFGVAPAFIVYLAIFNGTGLAQVAPGAMQITAVELMVAGHEQHRHRPAGKTLQAGPGGVDVAGRNGTFLVDREPEELGVTGEVLELHLLQVALQQELLSQRLYALRHVRDDHHTLQVDYRVPRLEHPQAVPVLRLVQAVHPYHLALDVLVCKDTKLNNIGLE